MNSNTKTIIKLPGTEWEYRQSPKFAEDGDGGFIHAHGSGFWTMDSVARRLAEDIAAAINQDGFAEALQMVKRLVKHLDTVTGQKFDYELSEAAWMLLDRLDPQAKFAPPDQK